jgi:hypothetical protein
MLPHSLRICLKRTLILTLTVFGACAGLTGCRNAISDDLAKNFVSPPDSARPWVYWFWVNNNVTKEGITADLEAMKRVGIGGVLIMAVDQGAPNGSVAFGSPEWRDFFKFSCQEAARLGLSINMNNDAGWCGSGGPWITPALSMQKMVYTETFVKGPTHFEAALAQPQAVNDYYEDIMVQAYLTPAGNSKIDDLPTKTALKRWSNLPVLASAPDLPSGQTINPAKIIDLTANFKDGKLTWDVPNGNWTIVRYGHTSTGVRNHPAPQGGLGLESDKLSAQATEVMYDGLMKKLVGDIGPLVGQALVSTHIDSWETGSQNWTPGFREQFQWLRGYDPQPYWPVMTGRVVQSREISERFLWDLRQTVSDLLIKNYAGKMREMAGKGGLRLSIEGYDAPCDEMAYAGQCDEPMGELWANPWGSSAHQTTEMVSAAHVYGKRIVGLETFTADNHEKWLKYFGSVKTLGDWAFCEGINRFVFHRYAMQPWLDRNPGMSMGPWGLHYERTETWWEQSKPWHEYLARCQYLLRQGLFVADICYLQPEGSVQFHVSKSIAGVGQPPDRPGYNYDGCNADVVLTRMSVKNGRLILPDGMSYRLLVLPDSQTMTPALMSKIAELVKAGATVVGPKPQKSPSLSGYPEADQTLAKTANEVWGDCDGQKITEHAFGAGKVIWGPAPEKVLANLGVPEDFQANTMARANLRYIHRQMDDGTELYFIANKRAQRVEAMCTFRVAGKQPELWWPESGKMEPVGAFKEKNRVTRLPLQLEAAESVFVIFHPGQKIIDPVVSLTRDGQESAEPVTKIVVQKATYGILNDSSRSRDVRAKVQALVDGGNFDFPVSTLAQGDDPAPQVVKILRVDYTADGLAKTFRGQDQDTIHFESMEVEKAPEFKVTADGQWNLEAWKNGHYVLTTAAGKTVGCDITGIPDQQDITGPWEVTFPPGNDAPDKIMLDQLASWSNNANSGVKYFSGTAIYRKTFTFNSEVDRAKTRIDLDLGNVQVIAQLKVNGKDMGILWKYPYETEITDALKPGENTLEIKVTNLWINRMIGDEQLPEDSRRNPNGTLKEWPQWLQAGKPSPTGRYTFTTWRLWNKDSPLQDSGLIGPVRLKYATRLTLQKP